MVTPLISIIIVVFNGEKTLKKAINSVKQQSFHNYELIIVDGQSTDNTLQIIKEKGDGDLRWISEPDKGIYDAMNKGIDLAKGEWIYFLGCDDELYNENVLQHVSESLINSPVKLIYGDVLLIPGEKQYDGVFSFEKLLKKNISHQSIFYNKSIFEVVGKFNLAYQTHADWDLNIRCFKEASIYSQYINSVIARFAFGGLSTHHDKYFLRESLLPQKLQFLNSAGMGYLHSIKNYDEYWRLLRNANVRSVKELNGLSNPVKVISKILCMMEWQEKIPAFLLKIGIISKACMIFNYIFSYNKTAID